MTSIQNNMSYDFNKDGKVTYDDYEYATKNNITLSTDEVNSFDALKLSEIVGQIEENNGEIETSIVDEEKAKNFAQNLSAPPDTNSAKTLSELQVIAANLSAYIKNCSQSVKYLESINTDLKSNLDELENKLNIAKQNYETKVAQLENHQNQLTVELQKALTISGEETDAMNSRSKNAIDKAISEYKDGKYPNVNLQSVITSKLSNIGIDKTRIEAAFSNADSTSSTIKSCVSGIETIVYDIKTANIKYNNVNTNYNTNVNLIGSLLSASRTAADSFQNGFTVRQKLRQAIIDKYSATAGGNLSTTNNPQVQMLNEFLTNKELDNMPLSDAKVLLPQIFNSIVSYDEKTNTFRMPAGSGGSATIFNGLVASLKDNYTTNTSFVDELTGEEEEGGADAEVVRPTDPIGFTYKNTKYEFIADKNNDGKFNDSSEFLGAENGWDEMIAYDADANGIIEGEELAKLKLLKIAQDGKYSFASADKAGIEKIDLSTYNKISEKQINNNVLEGTYDISINGEDVEGVQTFDTAKNLENTYATVFDKTITDKTQNYSKNPFMEAFVEQVDTEQVLAKTEFNKDQTEDTVETSAQKAESKAQSYTITEQDTKLTESKDTSNSEEPAIAEENSTEKKKKEV